MFLSAYPVPFVLLVPDWWSNVNYIDGFALSVP